MGAKILVFFCISLVNSACTIMRSTFVNLYVFAYQNDIRRESLSTQFDRVKRATTDSHVMDYGQKVDICYKYFV